MNAQIYRPAPSLNEQKITSIEIAEISGKRHTDLLRSIRKQEEAWEKVNERKFTLVKKKDAKGELRPVYELTKAESLYISSKFNDEIRAKLVSRWMELELNPSKPTNELPEKASDYPENTIITVKMGRLSNQIYVRNGVIYAKFGPLSRYIGYSDSPTYLMPRFGEGNSIKVPHGKSEYWYINLIAFKEMIKNRGNVEFSKIQMVYKEVFGVDVDNDDENPYTYMFTDSEMLNVIHQVNKKPINRGQVLELLFNGKI